MTKLKSFIDKATKPRPAYTGLERLLLEEYAKHAKQIIGLEDELLECYRLLVEIEVDGDWPTIIDWQNWNERIKELDDE